jgi:two-component system, NarL family, nitrate/nitrite response regulator NarL
VSPIKILIVDDSKAFREFAAAALRRGDGLQVVGEAANGSEGVQKAEELRPHLILLDISLPKLNGIQASRLIRECAPESKVVFLSAQIDLDVVNAALGTGALGYIQKVRASRDLMPALKAALQGMQFVSRELKVPVFDIFAGMVDKNATWVETTRTLSSARERMEIIATQNPGHYFVFSRTDHSILVKTNTQQQPERLLESDSNVA